MAPKPRIDNGDQGAGNIKSVFSRVYIHVYICACVRACVCKYLTLNLRRYTTTTLIAARLVPPKLCAYMSDGLSSLAMCAVIGDASPKNPVHGTVPAAVNK